MVLRQIITDLARRPLSPREESAVRSHLAEATLPEDGLAARLQQECAEMTAIYGSRAEFGKDVERGFWVRLPEWPLPEGLNASSCPVILLVPRAYPLIPPAFLYLPAGLAAIPGWKPSLAFPCLTDAPSAENWQTCAVPQLPWRQGDNLEYILRVLHVILVAATRVQTETDQESDTNA